MTAYPALITTSRTVSSGGTRSPSDADDRPIRVRSSNTSTRPIRAPRTSTTPRVGWMSAAASRSSVVLPAPLGPRTTHRSSSSTVQSTESSNVVSPRRTVTPSIRMTKSPGSDGAGSLVVGNNDSEGDPCAATGHILADRVGLPVGCPCRARRGAVRGRVVHRGGRRSVPGRRRSRSADGASLHPHRAHLRRLARARAGGRRGAALRLPGARSVPALGGFRGPTRPRSSWTPTPGGSPAPSRTSRPPAAGRSTR